jgi:hypothetical protein
MGKRPDKREKNWKLVKKIGRNEKQFYSKVLWVEKTIAQGIRKNNEDENKVEIEIGRCRGIIN